MSAKIAAKLVAAMKAVDAVEKKGRNALQNYSYVKATDVANEVRKALIAAGVAFTYSVEQERTWEGTTKNGGTQYFCSLLVNATFTDSESGEALTVQGLGWGADSQDKAPYKAMTGALKYALRMNFLIPDESDPEEGHEEETTKGRQISRPHLIAKAKAEKLRGELIAYKIPADDVKRTLLKHGFANCNEITEDKYGAVSLEFQAMIDTVKDEMQGAAN